MADLRIVPTTEDHIAGIHAALCAIATERRYIGFAEPPPLESSLAFVSSLIAGAGVQLVLLDGDTVAGWCDITRHPRLGFRHAGTMGMALLPAYRGQGWGRKLLVRTMDAARAQGIWRIELEVFASNTRAIALYESLGYQREGLKRRARKLDGTYDDDVIMALLFPDPDAP